MCETPCVGILRLCGSETQTIMGPAYIPPVSAAGLGRASVAGFVWYLKWLLQKAKRGRAWPRPEPRILSSYVAGVSRVG